MVVFLNTLFLTQLFQSPFFGFFGTANIDFFRFFCTFCQQNDTVVGYLDETAANITDMPGTVFRFITHFSVRDGNNHGFMVG